MIKERFFSIDILRGVAIIAVIAIHVLSFNLNSPSVTFVWNYLHFIIVAFLFCSRFVSFAKYRDTELSLRSVGPFYKKRLVRIVMPFYIYLVFHYALAFLFPSLFSGLGLKFSWGYVLDSIILLDGVPLNWLPLLFVYMALLFPGLLYLYKRKPRLLTVYLGVGLASVLSFSIWVFPYQYYRYVMWLPWSLFFVLPWYYFQHKERMLSANKNLLLAGVSFLIYIAVFILWQHLNRPMNLIDNKYPPNIFYISYELAGTAFILALANLSFWKNAVVRNAIAFISKFSYALFFVHYIVIDVELQVQKTFGFHILVWLQLLLVLVISIGMIYGYSKLRSIPTVLLKRTVF